jgi:hypothetical protein
LFFAWRVEANASTVSTPHENDQTAHLKEGIMRWYKGACLIAPAMFAALATAAAQSNASGADEAHIRAIVYSLYATQGYRLPTGTPRAPHPGYTPSTAAMYKQYGELTKDDDPEAESPLSNYCECQELDERRARLKNVSVVRVGPDLIDATAEHIEIRETKKTRIRFQKDGSSWKIHDVFFANGGTLRGEVAAEIAGRSSAKKPNAVAEPSVAQKPAATQRAVAANPTPLPIPTAAPASMPAQPVSVCGDNPRCVEVSSFVANVSDVRESTIGNVGTPIRVMAVTLRFRNSTSGPLALGYVAGSGVVTDDRGNRYITDSRRIRGLGEVGAVAIDPKFVLRPGESGDARFEFSWQPMGALIGAHPVIDLAVREIESLPGNQWRLGREYALHFSDGSPPVVVSAPAASRPAGPVPATAAASDPCAKKQDCFSAGPFVAEITRMAQSQSERFRDIQFSVRFQNLTAQPLVLGQTQWSTLVVDDVGNRYTSAWTALPEVRGMGLVRTGQQPDASFVLQPGASREANYAVRFDAGAARLGSVYNVDFAVEELQLFPGNQVRSVRQFPVGFHDVKIARWRGWRNLIDIRIEKRSP